MMNTTMTVTDQSPFITYEAASDEFGVSHFVLRRLAGRGEITRRRSTRDGRVMLLDRRELEERFNHGHAA